MSVAVEPERKTGKWFDDTGQDMEIRCCLNCGERWRNKGWVI